MKQFTSSLIGAALDWAVAKCNGQQGRMQAITSGSNFWSPSTDWAAGGPIIEREGISIRAMASEPIHWSCGMYVQFIAPSPLIAAMRNYVASKLGDTVEIPEELL